MRPISTRRADENGKTKRQTRTKTRVRLTRPVRTRWYHQYFGGTPTRVPPWRATLPTTTTTTVVVVVVVVVVVNAPVVVKIIAKIVSWKKKTLEEMFSKLISGAIKTILKNQRKREKFFTREIFRPFCFEAVASFSRAKKPAIRNNAANKSSNHGDCRTRTEKKTASGFVF